MSPYFNWSQFQLDYMKTTLSKPLLMVEQKTIDDRVEYLVNNKHALPLHWLTQILYNVIQFSEQYVCQGCIVC